MPRVWPISGTTHVAAEAFGLYGPDRDHNEASWLALWDLWSFKKARGGPDRQGILISHWPLGGK